MKKLSEDKSPYDDIDPLDLNCMPSQGLNLAQSLVLGVALGAILVLAARLFL